MRYMILGLLALLCISMNLQAQDNSVPSETPADNECYAGGTMEGKCDTEWEWQCGWYMARYNRSVFGSSGVPTWCDSLLALNTGDPFGFPSFPFATCTATSASGVTSLYELVAFSDSGMGYHAVASTSPSYVYIDFFMYYAGSAWVQNEGMTSDNVVSTTCPLPSFP